MNYRTPIKGLRSRFYRIRLLLDGRYGPSGHGSPGGISAFSLGVPVVLLHGVDGSGGYRDEIITFGLLGGLVLGLVFLSFRGARNKKKKSRARNRRGRNR